MMKGKESEKYIQNFLLLKRKFGYFFILTCINSSVYASEIQESAISILSTSSNPNLASINDTRLDSEERKQIDCYEKIKGDILEHQCIPAEVDFILVIRKKILENTLETAPLLNPFLNMLTHLLDSNKWRFHLGYYSYEQKKFMVALVINPTALYETESDYQFQYALERHSDYLFIGDKLEQQIKFSAMFEEKYVQDILNFLNTLENEHKILSKEIRDFYYERKNKNLPLRIDELNYKSVKSMFFVDQHLELMGNAFRNLLRFINNDSKTQKCSALIEFRINSADIEKFRVHTSGKFSSNK